ncbi:HEPN domain-containing protein [Candidatus Woesearchaeota archaeon]|nr:HEPN domain-containing protein [Candidatus Woesearchaeota archaeon]
MNIKECLEQGFLVRIGIDPNLIKKELVEAGYDMKKAGKAFTELDFKWSIIQSYYSMFHSGRALLFRLGYKERRHFAIGVVLEDLNKKGKLESRFVNDFNAAVDSREGADYHYIYSEEIAQHILDVAREFNKRLDRLIKTL